LHVLHAGDADHHGAEDDRRDHHLDQLDEGVAQRLHRLAGGRPEVAEHHTDHDGHDDLEVQRPVKGFAACHGCLLRGWAPGWAPHRGATIHAHTTACGATVATRPDGRAGHLEFRLPQATALTRPTDSPAHARPASVASGG